MNKTTDSELRPHTPARPKALAFVGTCLALQLLTCPTLTSAQAAEGTEARAQAYDQAMVEYERNHWRAAFSQVAQLADQGDAKAARLALRMHRLGPRLFGMHFDLSSARLRQWGATVAQDDLANCDVPSEVVASHDGR